MRYIWLFLVVLSLSLMLFANPAGVLPCLTTSAQNAFKLTLDLVAIYTLWLGIINVAKKCGLLESLAKKLQPILHKLFGTKNDEICQNLSLNISANLLGVGNASTPPALKATKQMDKGDGKMTKGMAMLFVINCCGLAILPTTVLSIRAVLGSTNPTSVVLPCLITSLVTTAVGVLLVNVFFKGK